MVNNPFKLLAQGQGIIKIIFFPFPEGESDYGLAPPYILLHLMGPYSPQPDLCALFAQQKRGDIKGSIFYIKDLQEI